MNIQVNNLKYTLAGLRASGNQENNKGKTSLFPEVQEESDELDFKSIFSGLKDELGEKIISGDTVQTFMVGATEMSIKDWDRLIKNVDMAINKEDDSLVDYLKGNGLGSCPYSAMAKDGVISYNGAEFSCDYEHNMLTLGDMSDSSHVLTIKLPSGGFLRVNVDNFDDVIKAIDMFSPQDQIEIMKQIRQYQACMDKKEQFENETEDAIVDMMQ